MINTKDGIHENKQKILDNKYSIRENQKTIQENRSAIHELKTNCANKCVPYDVFDSTVKIVHRLIVILAIVIALLFISNAVWIYAWHHADFNKQETTVITKDGVSNIIGRDGEIE